MSEDEGMTRRDVLRYGGGAVAGAALGGIVSVGGYLTHWSSEDLPTEIELAQTAGLAEQAEAVHDDREYALDRMREYTEAVIGDLFDRAGLPDPEISYASAEPEIEAREIGAVRAEWDAMTGGDADAQLLLTEDYYTGATGQAEMGSGASDCLCGVDDAHSDAGVLGEGYDLLQIDPGDVREEVLVEDYDVETGERYLNFSPHRTAIAGVHEIGHNLCLPHDMGDVDVEQMDGFGRQIHTSVMAASYTDRFAEEEGIVIRGMDDIYWDAAFSDQAVAAVEDQYEGLL